MPQNGSRDRRRAAPPSPDPATGSGSGADGESTVAAVALRLAVGRDGLGIELARPATLGCIDVVELVVRLPKVKFPFDVSGGVAKFRHRRGELERLAFELDAIKLARWAEPKLRGLVSAGPCEVAIFPRRFGATVSVASAGHEVPSGKYAALAFEVSLVPHDDAVSLVVHSARGANLRGVPTGLAIAAMRALLGPTAERRGAVFVVSTLAARIAQALLPEAGARAPSAEEMHVVGLGESAGVLFVALTRAGASLEVPAAPADEAARAIEIARLCREGDDARTAGDLERARRHDVAALERAPRHPEIARRIAEIDRSVGGRAEVAVATLREADRAAEGRAPPVGLLLGELLVESEGANAAIAALLQAGEHDPAAAVGAMCFARAAELAPSPEDALSWLDAALARAPRAAELRWQRARRRLRAGAVAGANADVQELEAMASGARERHAVLVRAAELMRELGLRGPAATFYERALVYRPDDPAAIAGLGAALAAEGRPARGAALLSRAIELGTARQMPTSWMDIELAKILAEGLHDRSAAIARLRAIDDDDVEAPTARALEGRYRHAIGDLAGASLAFARLRELCTRGVAGADAAGALLEAADLEVSRGELASAQRHLATAMARDPGDAEVAARYRAISARIASDAGVRPPEPILEPAPAAPEPAPAAPEPAPTPAAAPAPAEPEEWDEGKAEARVEILTRTLQLNPNDDTVVDELAGLLLRLGKSHELFALLSARLEDAPEDRRAALLPKHLEVLSALENDARSSGRDAEADLFKMAREALL